MSAGAVRSDRRLELNRRARLLAWFTVGYNAVEGVVALAAGLVASSAALVSFGLDSAVEVLSALAVAWQFSGRQDPREREHATMRFIAVAFITLAAYVTYDAVRTLLGGTRPEASPVGIGLGVASVVMMPALVWAKRRTGRELGSASVVADSTQNLLCTYMSVVLLVGLSLNATLGWAWADPVAALLIAAIAAREGIEAWRGDPCCPPITSAVVDDGRK